VLEANHTSKTAINHFVTLSMEYHYEYSTYNSHHKVLVNLQASNMDALKSKSCMPFSQICFHVVARRCRKSSSFSAFI